MQKPQAVAAQQTITRALDDRRPRMHGFPSPIYSQLPITDTGTPINTSGRWRVVLDGETMPYVDVTAAKMLTELAADLERDGVQLLIARDIGQVRDVLRSAGDDGHLSRVFPTVEAAVQAALAGHTAPPPGPSIPAESSP
jgi:anti-anti-sigma regulatory factor